MTDEPWFNRHNQETNVDTYPNAYFSTKNCRRGITIKHVPGTHTVEQVEEFRRKQVPKISFDESLKRLSTKLSTATVPRDIIVRGRVAKRAKKATRKAQQHARRQNRGNAAARR